MGDSGCGVVLTSEYRRHTCRFLATCGDVATLEDLTTYVITEVHDGRGSQRDGELYREVAVELHHIHLPKLERAGVLRYDSAERVARPTAALDDATEFCEKL